MSALSGMTGFARENGESGGTTWTWEVRSVNGKSLDVRLRMPSEFSALDAPIRKVFASTFTRGNIQISLALQSGAGSESYLINDALLDDLMAAADKRREPVRLDQMLLVPGVVMPSIETRNEEAKAELETALSASARALASRLKSARDAEGAALAPLLSGAIDRIIELVDDAETIAATQVPNLRSALKSKLSDLLGQDLPEDRVAQEAALLALKADVREELDRLKAHCDQARAHLSKGSPIGRKLDFLCQEFNRETNTLCSKSADIDLTRIGLELKSVVEQFREQAANVE